MTHLEASKHVDEERMSHRICDLKDAFLGQQRFHLVPGDDVALLQRLNCKVFAGVLVLSQNNLETNTPVITQM